MPARLTPDRRRGRAASPVRCVSPASHRAGRIGRGRQPGADAAGQRWAAEPRRPPLRGLFGRSWPAARSGRRSRHGARGGGGAGPAGPRPALGGRQAGDRPAGSGARGALSADGRGAMAEDGVDGAADRASPARPGRDRADAHGAWQRHRGPQGHDRHGRDRGRPVHRPLLDVDPEALRAGGRRGRAGAGRATRPIPIPIIERVRWRQAMPQLAALGLDAGALARCSPTAWPRPTPPSPRWPTAALPRSCGSTALAPRASNWRRWSASARPFRRACSVGAQHCRRPTEAARPGPGRAAAPDHCRSRPGQGHHRARLRHPHQGWRHCRGPRAGPRCRPTPCWRRMANWSGTSASASSTPRRSGLTASVADYLPRHRLEEFLGFKVTAPPKPSAPPDRARCRGGVLSLGGGVDAIMSASRCSC